jgi:hypothetical protein
MRKTKKSSSTTSDSECCKQAAAAGEAGERETDQTPSASDDAPKLDDGFYEIETIRRKRLRKVSKNPLFFLTYPFRYLLLLVCCALIFIDVLIIIIFVL